jgi:hypothetical protein
VHRVSAPAGSAPPANPGAATLILDPVLMTEGLIGSLQALEVSVFGADQEPLAGQAVSLKTKTAAGAVLQSLSAVANASGKAVFSVPIAASPREYEARTGNVGSNTIQVTPLP